MPFSYPTPQHPPDAEHITIYYNRNEFAAWPFNHGFWSFSGTQKQDELVISFSRGPCSYQNKYDMSHSVVDALGGSISRKSATPAVSRHAHQQRPSTSPRPISA